MPTLRQDPTTKEWIVFATERAQRPDHFVRHASTAERKPPASDCPFCPGNESSTPPAILTLPGRNGFDWSVRVVPNKFAALVPGSSMEHKRVGNIYREMEGVGAHEVVIESPDHDQAFALMPESDIWDVLKVYKRRYQSLRQERWGKLILIFKNYGESAGTSLEHSHSQIVATPVVPKEIRQRHGVATVYYDDTGRCIYCDIVKEEIELRERIVLESDYFLVFHPFASRSPFETWIAPKRHLSSFGDVSDRDLKELAQLLKATLARLFTALGDPDYNYVIHSAPVEDEHKSYYLWHVQIVPRLAKRAGFELGSGMSINTALPEETARFMRG